MIVDLVIARSVLIKEKEGIEIQIKKLKDEIRKSHAKTRLKIAYILVLQGCEENKVLTDKNYGLEVLLSETKGLSISRNIAIISSSKYMPKYINFIDEDTNIIHDGYMKECIKEFTRSYKDLALLLFIKDSLLVNIHKHCSNYLTNFMIIQKAITPKILFPYKDIYDNNMVFNTNFGLGKYNNGCEENIMCYEMYKKGVRIKTYAIEYGAQSVAVSHLKVNLSRYMKTRYNYLTEIKVNKYLKYVYLMIMAVKAILLRIQYKELNN